MCFYVNIVFFREPVDLADGSVLNLWKCPENRRGGHDKGEDGESGEQALV